MVMSSSVVPRWLETMLAEEFFKPCATHAAAKKNEKNIYCLDCCSGLCARCLRGHRTHRLLQIRRYVYHDVVRVHDLAKLINCASIQSYTANSAKVVFLNQRTQSPQNRPPRGGSGNPCRSCDRPLQDLYHYCSLSCKVKYLMSDGGLEKHLYECDYLPLPDDGQLTPDSTLESPGSSTSGPSAAAGGCGTTECTAMSESSAMGYRKRGRKQEKPNRSPVC